MVALIALGAAPAIASATSNSWTRVGWLTEPPSASRPNVSGDVARGVDGTTWVLESPGSYLASSSRAVLLDAHGVPTLRINEFMRPLEFEPAAEIAGAADGSALVLSGGLKLMKISTSNVITSEIDLDTTNCQPGNPSSLDLLAHSDGTRWVLSSGIICRYSASGVELSHTNAGGALDQFDFAMAESADGSVLVGTNDSVVRLAADGSLIGEYGSAGTGNGQFHSKVHSVITLPDNGYVAIDDTRMQRFTAAGTFAETIYQNADSSLVLAGASLLGDGSIWTLLNDTSTGEPRFVDVQLDGSASTAQRPWIDGHEYFIVMALAVDPTNSAVYAGTPAWMLSPHGSQLARVSRSGVTTRLVPPASAGGDTVYATGMDVAPDGSIWVTDRGSDGVATDNYIRRYSPTGTLLGSIHIASSVQDPWRLDVQPDGTAWIADDNGLQVAHISSSGSVIAALPVPPATVVALEDTVYDVVAVAGGDVIVSSAAGIRRLAPSGVSRWFVPHAPYDSLIDLLNFVLGTRTSPNISLAAIDLEMSADQTLLTVDPVLNNLIEIDPATGDTLSSTPVSQPESTVPARSLTSSIAVKPNGDVLVGDLRNGHISIWRRQTQTTTVTMSSGTSGHSNIVRGDLRFSLDAPDGVSVRWRARWCGAPVNITAGTIKYRRLRDGRCTLVVRARAGSRAAAWTRRLIVDRVAPTAAARHAYMIGHVARIVVTDSVSGSVRRVRVVQAAHIGRNVIRLRVRDRAGNTRLRTVVVWRRMSLSEPRLNRGAGLSNAGTAAINAAFEFHSDAAPWYTSRDGSAVFIREVQWRLRMLGYRSIVERSTGVLDLPTIRQIQQFQRHEHIPPRGTVGPRTRRALDAAVTTFH